MGEQDIFWNNVKDWDKEVLNIISSGAVPPILNKLSRESKSSSIIDLGTGIGHLLPFLSERFDDVCALDYAPNLIKRAERENKKYTNIRYLCGDMRSLGFNSLTFDIALSVGSILPSSIDDVDIIFQEIFRILKRNGLFVGVIPSFDSLMYIYFLQHENLRKNGISYKNALEIFDEEREKHNIHLFGLYSGLKYFYSIEVQYWLEKTGFRDIKIEKLEYSWEYCRDHYFVYSPDAPKIWDWLVTARK